MSRLKAKLFNNGNGTSQYFGYHTEAELLYGAANKPLATKLRGTVHAFLERVDVLAWGPKVARAYAEFRVLSEAKGIMIDSLDMLIAAHAHATERILVTTDSSLTRLRPWVHVENWSA